MDEPEAPLGEREATETPAPGQPTIRGRGAEESPTNMKKRRTVRVTSQADLDTAAQEAASDTGLHIIIVEGGEKNFIVPSGLGLVHVSGNIHATAPPGSDVFPAKGARTTVLAGGRVLTVAESEAGLITVKSGGFARAIGAEFIVKSGGHVSFANTRGTVEVGGHAECERNSTWSRITVKGDPNSVTIVDKDICVEGKPAANYVYSSTSDNIFYYENSARIPGNFNGTT